MSNLINNLENIIYNLKLEFDSGKLPERAIDFLKTLKENLELELKDDELEQVSGGVIPKKITQAVAIALASIGISSNNMIDTKVEGWNPFSALINFFKDTSNEWSSEEIKDFIDAVDWKDGVGVLNHENEEELKSKLELALVFANQGQHSGDLDDQKLKDALEILKRLNKPAYRLGTENVEKISKWPLDKRKKFDRWINYMRRLASEKEVYDISVGKDMSELQAATKLAGVVKDNGQEALNSTLNKVVPVVAVAGTAVAGTMLINNIKNLYASASNSIGDLVYKMTHKGIDISVYKTVLKRIERRLKQKLVGREKEIDQIIEILTGYFESVVQSNGKFQGGLVLYLIGSPGTGKSTVMNIIEEEMGLGSCTVRMSDIVEDHGNGASSAATRLTMPIIKDNGQVKVEVDTEFTRQVKTGVPTLYCIDEVDKMRVHDSILQKRNLRNEKNEIMGGSIDEMLRNFGDTGQIAGQNVSGSILIATSNETIDDMKQLESSLYNRYKDYTVQFTDFTAEDYKEIINRRSETMINYYKKNYFTDISWSQDVLDYYAEKFEKEKAGGRGAENLVKKARALLSNYRDDLNGKIYRKNLLITMDNNNKLQVLDQSLSDELKPELLELEVRDNSGFNTDNQKVY